MRLFSKIPGTTCNMTLFKSWHGAPKIRQHPWRLLGNGLAPPRISQVFPTELKKKTVCCLHFSPNRTLDMKKLPGPTCLRNFHSPFSHFFTDPLTTQMHLYWLLRKMQADILFGRGIACLQLIFEGKYGSSLRLLTSRLKYISIYIYVSKTVNLCNTKYRPVFAWLWTVHGAGSICWYGATMPMHSPVCIKDLTRAIPKGRG